MSAIDSVLGWLAIGAAASLAWMMWPFLRGGSGVLIRFFLGPVGALVGGAVSRAVLPAETQADQLLFAVIGALLFLALSQVAWVRYARSKSVPAHAARHSA